MSSHPLARRHHQVADLLAAANLDALIVSNLANIRYLSGFAGTAGLLVVTGDRLYLLVDFRYSAAVDALVGAGVAPPSLAPVSLEASSGYDRQLVTLLGEHEWRRVGFEAAHVPVSRWRGWMSRLSAAGRAGGQVELADTERVVERCRIRKDDAEQAIMREAGERLSRVADDVLAEVVAAGRSELEIAADIDWRMMRAGFERPAFDTIVASGPNSALPHARPTTRQLADGDLVVLDFGGVQSGYCVDLTRTVGIGHVSDAARQMYAAVAEAQQAAIAAAQRPGVTTGEVDAAARGTLERYGLDRFFGHGTGHGLGLDVHEEPRLSRRSEDAPGDDPLAPGMAFTIEPGAYVEGLGGVRIEDDLLCTSNGCELLTNVPRHLREI